MQLGQFKISTFVEQKFKLDGGAMFGIIPKSIWQKLIEPDDDNLIPMVNNLFLLEAHGKNMLFDAGLGDSLSEREKKIYGTDGVSFLIPELAQCGLTPNDIDCIFLTHLHTDHVGGALTKIDGKYAPRFPNATHYVSRLEWEVAMKPDERTAAVYVPKRLKALKEQAKIHLVESDSQLFPGIQALFTGGHSEGHYALEIESEGTSVFYYADIFCTTAHLKVPYVPGTDLHPVDTMEIKRLTLPRIINQDIIMAFDHDTKCPLARIKQFNGRLEIEPVECD